MGYYGKEFDMADLFHIQRDIVDKKLIRKKELVAKLRVKRNLAVVLTFKFDVNEAQCFYVLLLCQLENRLQVLQEASSSAAN